MWKCSNGDEMTVNGNTGALTTYLQHTSDEDIQTLTINDFTFLTNRTKTVAMATTIEPVSYTHLTLPTKRIV